MKLLSFIASLFIRALCGTLRVRHVHVENIEKTPQYILAFWHSQILPMLHSRYRTPITVILSRSKDGEHMARVFDWYGAKSARGSSTRGGSAALRQVIRDARAGNNIAVTPDGPKGPPRVLKDGVVYTAQMTGLPIVLSAFAARKKWLLRSWDRMVVPRPFSRAIYLYSEPIVVPRDGDVEQWRAEIERRMNALADEAGQMVEKQ
jgi:lysophospholipid acyltransferase (LPLAT)-like uncharacterized protein